MDKKLEFIVEALLEKHGGGTAYFDELDLTVSSPYFMEQLMEVVYDENKIFHTVFVVSGNFGYMFYKYHKQFFPIIVYNGGLRKDDAVPKVMIKNYKDKNVKGHRYIFLDDSLYKGRTLAKISTLHDIEETFVIYDGSHHQFFNVTSLYRYFDHYDKNGNKKS